MNTKISAQTISGTVRRTLSTGATMVARAKIAQFAIAERLPSMFGWSEYADAGGLMSYGANQREAYVRLAPADDSAPRESANRMKPHTSKVLHGLTGPGGVRCG